MSLDAASFLLQWATGGLAFTWVTTRRRDVGLGYGWLMRIVYGLLGLAAVVLLVVRDGDDGAATALALAGAVTLVLGTGVALAVSVARRGAGVTVQREQRERREARVAAMVASGDAPDSSGGGEANADATSAATEFPPSLDLIAPLAGLIGLCGAAGLVGGDYPLALVRLLAGAALIGGVSDAMLLGHWYLVQPGLRREPLKELVVATGAAWPVQVAALLVSPGMIQVLNGSMDDGYNGLLGWVWVACAVTTIALVGVTWAALRERYYSAVMSATGLLYLAILTAFGQVLIAWAVLAP